MLFLSLTHLWHPRILVHIIIDCKYLVIWAIDKLILIEAVIRTFSFFFFLFDDIDVVAFLWWWNLLWRLRRRIQFKFWFFLVSQWTLWRTFNEYRRRWIPTFFTTSFELLFTGILRETKLGHGVLLGILIASSSLRTETGRIFLVAEIKCENFRKAYILLIFFSFIDWSQPEAMWPHPAHFVRIKLIFRYI